MSKSHTLTADGCDRATAYHMSNKIVRHPDGLFVTWLDKNYRAVLAHVDPDSGTVLNAFPLAQGYDNHCGAALTLTPDNRLHAVVGGHAATAFIYRHSDTPADPASWSLAQSVGASPTYPSLVGMPDGSLVLAYRHTAFTGRWGTMIQIRNPEGVWGWPHLLMCAAAERYTFPTNALRLDAHGVLHIGLEFYKTYAPGTEDAKSVAVTHASSQDGGTTWTHDDERTVRSTPFGIEDAFLIAHDAAGNLRPGNVSILPDGRVALAIWNARRGSLGLWVRNAPGAWQHVDLTRPAVACRDSWTVNSQGRVAVGPTGDITVLTTVAPTQEWGNPRQHVRCLWLAADTLEVKRTYLIPKDDPHRAAWLPTLEDPISSPPEAPLVALYTDGTRGQGCTNQAVCAVRMLQLTEDLSD